MWLLFALAFIHFCNMLCLPVDFCLSLAVWEKPQLAEMSWVGLHRYLILCFCAVGKTDGFVSKYYTLLQTAVVEGDETLDGIGFPERL